MALNVNENARETWDEILITKVFVIAGASIHTLKRPCLPPPLPYYIRLSPDRIGERETRRASSSCSWSVWPWRRRKVTGGRALSVVGRMSGRGTNARINRTWMTFLTRSYRRFKRFRARTDIYLFRSPLFPPPLGTVCVCRTNLMGIVSCL